MRPSRDRAGKPQPEGPFVIALQTLAEGENGCDLAGTAVDLDLRPEDVVLISPVRLAARLYRAHERVEIQGTLRASCEMSCDRCLATVRRDLEIPFRIYGERRESRDRRSREEVREDDLGIVYHDGRFLDLTDEVRQLLLVELPWHVVCREDCQGLCPRCGGNRNEGACSCPQGPGAGDSGKEEGTA